MNSLGFRAKLRMLASALVLSLGASSTWALESLAQETSASSSFDPASFQKVSPEVVASFAEKFGVSADDPRLRTMFEELNKQTLEGRLTNLKPEALRYNPALRGSPDAKPVSVELSRLEIAAHYRFDAGVPFVPAPRRGLSPEERERAKETAMYFQNLLRASIAASKNQPPLPRCEVDSSDRSNPKSGTDSDRDVLFMAAKAPAEAAKYFGAHTLIIECSGKPGDRCAALSELLNLRCLPTRLRTENGRTTRFEGRRALMNFDLNKNGKMDPVVDAHVAEFLGAN